MSDPLLTIDEATRAFRVSPKTIRRRLAAGEIEGAYKRPGRRGPEWVIPRGALEAAGFVPRGDVVATELPEADDDRAAYWQQRALDAEAALRAAGSPAVRTVAAAGPPRRRARWAVLAAIVAVAAVLAGVVVLVGGGEEGADGPAAAPGPGSTVRAALEVLTDAGDAVGVMGRAPAGALPRARRAVPVAQLEAAGARYVLAAHDGAREPTAMAALRRSARVVLDLETDTGAVVVFDVTRQEAPATAQGSGGPTTTGAASVAGADPPTTPAGEPAPPGPDPEPPTGPATGPAVGDTEPTTVVVELGDSFWSIAASLVQASMGRVPTSAEVTPVWVALVAANEGRLVQPGTPDLLHVGQQLVVPGG